MKWICQNNLGDQENVQEIKRVCEKHNFLFESYKAIPFSDELPPVEEKGQNIFYGSINWIQNIYKSKKWNPGVFLNDNFNYLKWGKHYEELLLNKDFVVMKLSETTNLKDDYYFIRPTGDNKEIAGTVMKSSDIASWVEKIIIDDNTDILNLQILVAEPKIIVKEWRLFVVDGRVSSGSQYRTYGNLNKSKDIPDELVYFVENCVIPLYSPHDIFVLDMGILDDETDFKVIEIGSFNSAGFYSSNIEKIILDINSYINKGN